MKVIIHYLIAAAVEHTPGGYSYPQVLRLYCDLWPLQLPSEATIFLRADAVPACPQKSKDCPYKVATKLPVPSGNATWHVPERIPSSTVYIRAWLWDKMPDGTYKQVNYGRTKGYLQVSIQPDSPV